MSDLETYASERYPDLALEDEEMIVPDPNRQQTQEEFEADRWGAQAPTPGPAPSLEEYATSRYGEELDQAVAAAEKADERRNQLMTITRYEHLTHTAPDVRRLRLRLPDSEDEARDNKDYLRYRKLWETAEQFATGGLAEQDFTREEHKVSKFTDIPKSTAYKKLQGLADMDISKNFRDLVDEEDVPVFTDMVRSIAEESGKMGVGESLSQALTEKKGMARRLPFQLNGVIEAMKIYRSMSRLNDDDYEDSPEGDTLRSEDLKEVQNQTLRQEVQGIRGMSVGGMAATNLLDVPAFMMEMGATAGALPGTIKPPTAKTGSIVKSMFRGMFKKNLQRGGFKHAAKLAGRAVKRGAVQNVARIPYFQHRALEGYFNRRVTMDPDRELMLREVEESPWKTMLKAQGNVFIENFSETAGNQIGAELGLVTDPIKNIARKWGTKAAHKAFSKTAMEAIEEGWKRMGQNRTGAAFRDMLKAGGFDGILEEMGEERLGSIMRATFGMEDWGDVIPDGDEFLAEAIGFSIIPAGSMPTSFAGALMHGASRQAQHKAKMAEMNRMVADASVLDPAEVAKGQMHNLIQDKDQGPVQPISAAPQDPLNQSEERRAEAEVENARVEWAKSLVHPDVWEELVDDYHGNQVGAAIHVQKNSGMDWGTDPNTVDQEEAIQKALTVEKLQEINARAKELAKSEEDLDILHRYMRVGDHAAAIAESSRLIREIDSIIDERQNDSQYGDLFQFAADTDPVYQALLQKREVIAEQQHQALLDSSEEYGQLGAEIADVEGKLEAMMADYGAANPELQPEQVQELLDNSPSYQSRVQMLEEMKAARDQLQNDLVGYSLNLTDQTAQNFVDFFAQTQQENASEAQVKAEEETLPEEVPEPEGEEPEASPDGVLEPKVSQEPEAQPAAEEEKEPEATPKAEPEAPTPSTEGEQTILAKTMSEVGTVAEDLNELRDGDATDGQIVAAIQPFLEGEGSKTTPNGVAQYKGGKVSIKEHKKKKVTVEGADLIARIRKEWNIGQPQEAKPKKKAKAKPKKAKAKAKPKAKKTAVKEVAGEVSAEDQAKFEGMKNPQLWKLPEKQKYRSAKTSINDKKLPSGISRALKEGVWSEGMVNLDIGGGRYDNTTEAINKAGAQNYTYDPWNRTVDENVDAANAAEKGVDTVTIHNTLNVIKERALRERILRQAWAALKPGGKLMITIHPGDSSGKGKSTNQGESWQNNRPIQSYMNEVKRHFKGATKKGGKGYKTWIIAEKPAAVEAKTEAFTSTYEDVPAAEMPEVKKAQKIMVRFPSSDYIIKGKIETGPQFRYRTVFMEKDGTPYVKFDATKWYITGAERRRDGKGVALRYLVTQTKPAAVEAKPKKKLQEINEQRKKKATKPKTVTKPKPKKKAKAKPKAGDGWIRTKSGNIAMKAPNIKRLFKEADVQEKSAKTMTDAEVERLLDVQEKLGTKIASDIIMSELHNFKPERKKAVEAILGKRGIRAFVSGRSLQGLTELPPRTVAALKRIAKLAGVQAVAQPDGSVDILTADNKVLHVVPVKELKKGIVASAEADTRTIQVGLDGVFNHELTHLMRDLGMINDKEWDLLVGLARDRAKISGIRKLEADYEAAGQQLQTDDDVNHELIAEMIQDLYDGKIDVMQEVPKSLWDKIKDFIDNILRSLGITVQEDKLTQGARLAEKVAAGEPLQRTYDREAQDGTAPQTDLQQDALDADTFQGPRFAVSKTNRANIEGWLAQRYNTEDIAAYHAQIRAFHDKHEKLARAGVSPLHANQKTLMSIDISTDCPLRAMGSVCLYCYVEAPRVQYFKAKAAMEKAIAAGNEAEADLQRRKMEGAKAKKVHKYVEYNNQILDMPEPMVKFFNSIGGMRMFASGDYTSQMEKTVDRILTDAKRRGLTIKAITKQAEFVKKFVPKYKNLRVNVSTDFLPDNLDRIVMGRDSVRKYSKLDRGRLKSALRMRDSRRLIAFGMSMKQAKALRKKHGEQIKIRYVGINRRDAIRATMNPDIDVVTIYHGRTNPDLLMDIWRFNNPAIFKNIGEKTLRQLAEIFQAPSAEIFSDRVTEKDLRESGVEGITPAQFKKVADNKVCCKTGVCSSCKVFCGFSRPAKAQGKRLRGGKRYSVARMSDIADVYEEQTRQEATILDEFLDSDPGSKISWSPVSFGRVQKIWNDTARMGFVRDERGLAGIADQIFKNLARLSASTDLAEHGFRSIEDILEDNNIDPDSFDKDRFFNEFFESEYGDPISDYGLNPLFNLTDEYFKADTAEDQLVILDRMLNVVHQRNDIAAFFIEGGTDSLHKLSDPPKGSQPDIRYALSGLKKRFYDRAQQTTENQRIAAAEIRKDIDFPSNVAGRALDFAKDLQQNMARRIESGVLPKGSLNSPEGYLPIYDDNYNASLRPQFRAGIKAVLDKVRPFMESPDIRYALKRQDQTPEEKRFYDAALVSGASNWLETEIGNNEADQDGGIMVLASHAAETLFDDYNAFTERRSPLAQLKSSGEPLVDGLGTPTDKFLAAMEAEFQQVENLVFDGFSFSVEDAVMDLAAGKITEKEAEAQLRTDFDRQARARLYGMPKLVQDRLMKKVLKEANFPKMVLRARKLVDKVSNMVLDHINAGSPMPMIKNLVMVVNRETGESVPVYGLDGPMQRGMAEKWIKRQPNADELRIAPVPDQPRHPDMIQYNLLDQKKETKKERNKRYALRPERRYEFDEMKDKGVLNTAGESFIDSMKDAQEWYQRIASHTIKEWYASHKSVRKIKDKNKRPDFHPLTLLLGTPQHIYKKIPVARAIYNEATKINDYKHIFSNFIFNSDQGEGPSDLGFITEFASKMRKEWKALQQYLINQDVEAFGYTVNEVEDDDGKKTYQVMKPRYNANGDVTYSAVNNAEYETEERAWMVAYNAEAAEYVQTTGSEAAGQALKSIRHMNHRMYGVLVSEAIENQKLREELGLPELEVEYDTGEKDENDKPVIKKISLFEALKQMGDRRGHYMPRIRLSGKFMLKATKEGTNPILRLFDSTVMRDAVGAYYELQGYKIEKQISNRPSEKAYMDSSLVAMNDLLQNTLAEMKRKSEREISLEDFGLEGTFEDYPRKDGGTDPYFVVRGQTNSQQGQTIKSLGAGRWAPPSDPNDKAWRIKNPSKDIEKTLAQALDTSFVDSLSVSAFGDLLVSQVANTYHQHGSQSRKIGRRKGTGKEVYKGYVEDVLRSVILAGKAVAGGSAKRIAAQNMMRLFMGTDVTWAEYKAKYPPMDEDGELLESGTKEYNEAMGELYTDYREMVREKRIDSSTQEHAFKDIQSYMHEVLRNEERSERIMNKIKGLASLKYLSGVAPGMVNMTALVTSVPAVFKKHGIPITSSFKLMAQGGTDYVRNWLYQKHGKGKGFENTKEGQEKEWLYNEIKNRGYDDALQNMEAMQALQGYTGKAWAKVMNVAMGVFSVTEKVNRASTIAGAYYGLKAKRQKEGTWDGSKATQEATLLEAKEISDDAHASYGKTNKPWWTRGGGAPQQAMSAWHMYKTFSQNYLQVLTQLGYDTAVSAKNKDAKQARQNGEAFAYMLLSPAVIAGAGATVAMPIISMLTKFLFKAVGQVPPEEPEEALHQWAGRTFGDPGERFSRQGLAGLAGFNLGGSLQIGITDLPTKPMDLLGAPASMAKDILQGTESILRGDVTKGAEKLSPRILAGPIRQMREASEGVTARNNQPLFYKNEQIKPTTSERWIRGFGFNPARTSAMSEEQWNERTSERGFSDRRGDIYAKIRRFYLTPRNERSMDDWDEIMEMIENYNAQVRKNRNKAIPFITDKSIRSQIKRMSKAPRKERIRSGEDVKKDKPVTRRGLQKLRRLRIKRSK